MNHLYEQNIASLLTGRAMCGERVRAMIHGFNEADLHRVDCLRCLEAYRAEHAQKAERAQAQLDQLLERNPAS